MKILLKSQKYRDKEQISGCLGLTLGVQVDNKQAQEHLV